MSHQQQLKEIQETISASIFKALELDAAFTVINAALLGSTDQSEDSPYQLKPHHLISMVEVFSDRSDQLTTLLAALDNGYRTLVDDLDKQKGGES